MERQGGRGRLREMAGGRGFDGWGRPRRTLGHGVGGHHHQLEDRLELGRGRRQQRGGAVADQLQAVRRRRARGALALLRGALLKVDVTVFWEVQAALLMVMLFFSFSRSEAPCPKSYSGSGAFDSSKHTEVGDVEVRSWRDASARCVPYVAWRLKAIKQDQRMERPEAAGNQDWVVIGRAPDPPFDIFWWLHLFWKLMP